MSEDPLSQFLSLIEARAVVSIGLDARGSWAVHVPPLHALKCNLVKRGECMLEVEGERCELATGDCFMVGPDLPFIIGSDLDRTPRPAAEVFAGTGDNGYARLDAGPGPELLCLSGRIALPEIATFLTDALPSLVVIRGESAAGGRMRWLMDRLEAELGSDAPGAAAMASQIMQMVFIELLRHHPDAPTHGWLSALSDPRIGRALRAIHRDPSRHWRLEDLAEISHLSRSQFSATFRAAVGHAPMDYVLRWRMALAQKALTQPEATVASVAAQSGYSSESAFIHAFRRINGTTPRQARQRARAQLTTDNCQPATVGRHELSVVSR